MKKICLFFWMFALAYVVKAQDKPIIKDQQNKESTDSLATKNKQLLSKESTVDTSVPVDSIQKDSTTLSKETRIPLNNKKKADVSQSEEEEITIKDYKIISLRNDTTHIDTTLSIQKEYSYNYLRKDDFELMPFSNVGQTYNSLGLDFRNTSLYPQIGARSKHFNYMEAEDINYYRVPTPATEMFFKTVFEQGQILDAFITMNTSRQLNFSLAYKGMRSLGKYQHILSSTGNFRFTTNYITKNERYDLKLHFVSQDILNQENGGLLNKEEQFESGDENFLERARIDVNYNNAQNFLLGKRYFLDHEYVFLKSKDSIKNYTLALGHQFNYETKLYRFEQSQNTDLFGEAFQTRNLYDVARLKTMYNQIRLNYRSNLLGSIVAKASQYDYNYFFSSIVIQPDESVVTNQLRDSEIAIGAEFDKVIGNFRIKADVNSNISGDLGGTNIFSSAQYSFTENDKLKLSLFSSSRMPNFNFLLYQSDYVDYNWQNTDQFLKEESQTLQVNFNSDKWLNLEASYSKINNHTYFGLSEIIPEEEDLEQAVQIEPYQFQNEITYLKLKVNKEFKFLKHFALNNTVMYQKVEQEENIINVPEIVTRNTLYYSNHLFKKALYLQTGVTFKYFTKYYSNAYSPLLGEFYIQEQEQLGEYPMIDFFINAKVQRTRIYFKLEHINSSFTGYNFYSAPNYPYRDFVIRFGLVWNFFT